LALSAVEAHLADCSPCGMSLTALRADLDAFKAEVPYATFRIEHERRLEAHRARGGNALLSWRAWLSLASAGALATLLFVTIPRAPVSDGGSRIKGAGVSLSLGVVEAGRLRAVMTGERLRPGSVTSLRYDAGDNHFVGVFGVDGAGRVSVYFPEGGDRLGAVPAGAAGELPFSLTLDEQPGRERFIAVFAPEPLPMDEILPALSGDLGAIPGRLPPGASVSSLWIEKAE